MSSNANVCGLPHGNKDKMTTTPIAAGPNDVTVRTRFEQWYLRDLRGNPANLELDENGEYRHLPTLLLAFAAGEKTEREAGFPALTACLSLT